jgi:Flp pilus assembly pilin Flp
MTITTTTESNAKATQGISGVANISQRLTVIRVLLSHNIGGGLTTLGTTIAAVWTNISRF